MKIAVLGDDRPSYINPLCKSFIEMSKKLNIECDYFSEGTDTLIKGRMSQRAKLKNVIKKCLNLFFTTNYSFENLSDFRSFAKILDKYDLIVVVAHMPMTLSKNCYRGIDDLRKFTNKPIVNYDLVSWTTRGPWCKKVMNDSHYGGFTGFKRFDYFFVVSNISEFPEKKDVNFPFTLIGGDFRNKNLFPEQKEFKVLIDFESEDVTGNKFIKERKKQIEVLKTLNIPYTILKGTYSFEQICSVYRKHSAIFLSRRESFGLPIVEVQLCGQKILTPYKYWAAGHYINKSKFDSGQGDLSPNFIVYNNEKKDLINLLIKLKEDFNPQQNIEIFKKYHPHLFDGHIENLEKIMKKFISAELSGNSHKNYDELERHIVSRIQNFELSNVDPIFNEEKFIFNK